MKIYTKTGDEGLTGLIGGSRVPKNDVRIEAYGTIDELNAFNGLMVSKLDDDMIISQLRLIQHKLFDIGANLAFDSESDTETNIPQITQEDVATIEQWIDKLGEKLPEQRFFILPGGSETGSLAHVCRTIARRAERRMMDIKVAGLLMDGNILVFINRLSDYYFILSRYLTVNQGIKEFFWKKED